MFLIFVNMTRVSFVHALTHIQAKHYYLQLSFIIRALSIGFLKLKTRGYFVTFFFCFWL